MAPNEILMEKAAAAHVEATLGASAIDDAKNASDNEHKATFWTAIKTHKRAVLWSAVISMSIVMEGYDTILLGNFWAYPEFQKKYGHYHGEELGWLVSGPWQAGLGNASVCGTIIGAFINGWATSRYGYRLVMVVSLFLMNCFIFVTFFAKNLETLLVGQIFCGLTWGVFATTGPAYASEVCPLALRGYLTGYVNLCWAIGQFIASGVLNGLIHRKDQWAYRIPFAVQWAWPLPLMIIIFFAPESPWFLTRKDRLDEAKKMLKRLGTSEEDVSGNLAMLVHTVKIEHEVTAGTSYWDCFKGVDLRRTEVCCVTFAGQILSGSTFAYSPTYFFTQAGVDVSNAYKLSLGGTAMAFLGTCLSWFLLTYMGRRTIYLLGETLCCLILLIVGIISVSSDSAASLWAQAGFTMFWLFVYSLTVGPIAYAIISETSSVRLRPQSVVLARNTYQIVNIVSGVLVPYMLNPLEWGWKGKTGFFWAGTAALMTVWAYFRLPEAKGRTYEELDIMFAKRVPARQFSSYEVDAYALASHEAVHERRLSYDNKEEFEEAMRVRETAQQAWK